MPLKVGASGFAAQLPDWYAVDEATDTVTVAGQGRVITLPMRADLAVDANLEVRRHLVVTDAVSRIENGVFQKLPRLETARLSRNLYKIPPRLFEKCGNLREVTLSEHAREIGSHAFEDCRALKQITLPPDLESIGLCAFANCTSLERIVIPQKIPGIWERCFANCRALKEIRLPERMTRIAEGAFAGCSALRRITVPLSVTAIEQGAFSAGARLHFPTPGVEAVLILSEEFDATEGGRFLKLLRADEWHDARTIFDMLKKPDYKTAAAVYLLQKNPDQRAYQRWARDNAEAVILHEIETGHAALVKTFLETDLITDRNTVETMISRSIEAEQPEVTAIVLSYRQRLFGGSVATPDEMEL